MFEPSFNAFNIFMLLGGIQGILLSALLISGKQYKRISNRFLSIQILTISIMNINNSFRDAGYREVYGILDYLPVNLTILIPFTLYYFVVYLINPKYRFSKKEYFLIIPIVIQFVHQIGGMVWYFVNKEGALKYNWSYGYIGSLMELISIILSIIVLILIIRKLSRYQKQLYNHYSEISDLSLDWLRYTFMSVFVVLALWSLPTVYELLGHRANAYFLYPLWISVSCIVYWLGYSIFFRKDLFEIRDDINLDIEKSVIAEEELPIKTVSSDLSIKTEDHYQRLIQLIEVDKLYTEPSLSMTSLAQKTELSNGYLSQIINQKEGKNFFEFINGYRIKDVQNKLVDPDFDHYSILGIAMEAGFKSKSTFNAAFKKATGKTPSAYRKGKK